MPRHANPLAATLASASDGSCVATGQGVCALSNASRPIRRPGRPVAGRVDRRPFPGTGGLLRRDRLSRIDTAHHDARHVRCRTDGAAGAGHRAGGAIGSLGGAGRNDGFAPSIGLGRVPLPGSPGRVRHRTRRRRTSLRIRPTPTEPFLGQETSLRPAGEAHACTARGPNPIGQAGAARASAPGPWISRPVACAIDDSRGIRETPWRRGRALEHGGDGCCRCEARRSARRRDVPLNVMPCPPTAIPRNAPPGRLVYGSEQTPRRCAGILTTGSITGRQSGVRVGAPKRMSPKRGRQPTRRSTS